MPGFDYLVKRLVGERFDVKSDEAWARCAVSSIMLQRGTSDTYTVTITDDDASCQLEISWDREFELFSIVASPEITRYTPFLRSAFLDVINTHHNDADNVCKASLLEHDGKMFCTVRVTCHVPTTFLEAPSSYLPARRFLLGNLSALMIELVDLFDDFDDAMARRADQPSASVVKLQRS